MASFELSDAKLVVTGELGGDEETPLRANLEKLLAGDATAVEVDMSGVPAITSICIGALVAFWIDLNEKQGTLKLDASDAVKRVLDMTGLTSVLMKQ